MTNRRSREQRLPDGRPTVVSLDWDYMYPSVLVDRSPGLFGSVAFVDPAELGLPPELVSRLESWWDRQEMLSGAFHRDQPPMSEVERRLGKQQDRELLTLAYDVRQALAPDVEVLLWGRPLEERPRSWWSD
ncbi:hypothetical protein GCU60_18970 [Blastococcus saxobsidens]|uniref:Uncharacterized protein n=1 Tax=Blastococcus saxobsidens TaxID=138336 RepID=A0A6L9W6W5_9ACTN|nr:hypothetical protein [Blastococcus saxobsidens]NEK87826.1 hypothetical protein [Blastococcus saxobsidens]